MVTVRPFFLPSSHSELNVVRAFFCLSKAVKIFLKKLLAISRKSSKRGSRGLEIPRTLKTEFEKLCGGVSGRRHYCTGVHNLFHICGKPAGDRSGCISDDNDL